MSGLGSWLVAHRRGMVALVLAALAFTTVIIAQRDVGVARDEVHYMTNGSRYAEWWIDLVTGKSGAASERAITSHFGGPRATDNNREHPPLMKTLFGFSERIFHRGLGWATQTTAYRVPTALVNALLVALVFLFGSRVWGFAEGVIASLLVLLLPRAFFHAGLAAFDAPMVAMWFAAVYAYWLSLESRWWCIGLGIAVGCALATKHNAIMIPAAIVPHYVWVAVRGAKGKGIGAALSSLVRTRPLVFVAVFALGPLVLVALWPWLWFDTIEHVRTWIGFHLAHVHYNFEYLGHNWNAPPFPWHLPLITTMFTVPVATLVAGAIGAGILGVRARRGDTTESHNAPALLWLLSAGVAVGPFLLRTTPIFGAEKHWAPAIPTICLFAGVGVVAVARHAAASVVDSGFLAPARERVVEVAATLGLAALVVAAAGVETVSSHPYALSWYNALAGGTPGGADLGMNRQFWGVSARGVLPMLNELAATTGKSPFRVYAHDASPAWGIYHREGLLDPRVVDAGHEQAGINRSDAALVIHELHFNRHDYMVWSAYATVQPAAVLTAHGVPIVSVYVRAPPVPGGQ